jgi:hypothetical protein
VTLRMFDAVDLTQIPPGADAYAGYVDGAWITAPALRARFPGAHILSIAVFPEDDADCLDVEPGDATPQQAPVWVRRQQSRGIMRPVLYCSASVVNEVLGNLAAAGIGRSEVRLWSAHYTGISGHICGPGSCMYIDPAGRPVPACDGTQWTSRALGRNLDESVLCDDFFGAPAPLELVEDDDMIMVSVDQASVPKGIPWPGDFLLFGDGTLGHITPATASVNNVSSYKAAGIQGPVTITYQEFLARGGKPPATGEIFHP